jgi:hypothetical protein
VSYRQLSRWMAGDVREGRAASMRVAELHVVHHLRQVLVETRHLDGLLGPGDLVDPVNSQLRLVGSLLRNAGDDEVRRALWTLTAELSQFLAWLLLDLAQYDHADTCYRRGLRAAHEARDVDLASYLLGWLSFVAIYRNLPDDALAFATAARNEGQASACQALRAWLVAIEARTLAATGNEACLAGLDVAYNEISQPEREANPSWLYHFDDGAPRVPRHDARDAGSGRSRQRHDPGHHAAVGSQLRAGPGHLRHLAHVCQRTTGRSHERM